MGKSNCRNKEAEQSRTTSYIEQGKGKAGQAILSDHSARG